MHLKTEIGNHCLGQEKFGSQDIEEITPQKGGVTHLKKTAKFQW